MLAEKIRDYREYARMIEELEALKSAIADELKAAAIENGKAEETKAGEKITLIVGEYKLSLSDCIRRDIDKKRLDVLHNQSEPRNNFSLADYPQSQKVFEGTT